MQSTRPAFRQHVVPHPPGAIGSIAGEKAGANLRGQLLIAGAHSGRPLTLAARKRARAKNAQNCFLYRLLLVVAASTFGFLIDGIETEFLRADCTSEFSRNQGRVEV